MPKTVLYENIGESFEARLIFFHTEMFEAYCIQGYFHPM